MDVTLIFGQLDLHFVLFPNKSISRACKKSTREQKTHVMDFGRVGFTLRRYLIILVWCIFEVWGVLLVLEVWVDSMFLKNEAYYWLYRGPRLLAAGSNDKIRGLAISSGLLRKRAVYHRCFLTGGAAYFTLSALNQVRLNTSTALTVDFWKLSCHYLQVVDTLRNTDYSKILVWSSTLLYKSIRLCNVLCHDISWHYIASHCLTLCGTLLKALSVTLFDCGTCHNRGRRKAKHLYCKECCQIIR